MDVGCILFHRKHEAKRRRSRTASSHVWLKPTAVNRCANNFCLILTLFTVLGYPSRHPESIPLLPSAIWESIVRLNVPQLLPVNIANSRFSARLLLFMVIFSTKSVAWRCRLSGRASNPKYIPEKYVTEATDYSSDDSNEDEQPRARGPFGSRPVVFKRASIHTHPTWWYATPMEKPYAQPNRTLLFRCAQPGLCI